MNKQTKQTNYTLHELANDELYLNEKCKRLENSIVNWTEKIENADKYSKHEIFMFTERLFNCTEKLKHTRKKLGGTYSSLNSFGY